MSYDSVYDSIRKHEIMRNLDALKNHLSAIENYATGYVLVGDTAEEVAEVARRLQRLARPVEADQPAKPREPRRAA
jgi:CHASE3 domain sensor protein